MIPDPADVVAVVVTHEHDDHWSPEHLARLVRAHPDVRIFGPSGVVAAAPAFPIDVVRDGDSVTVGRFRLQFFGERHATIHRSIPAVDNIGVLVNETFYYAGDAFVAPGVPVDTLAAPAFGPWMKIAEAMDFVLEVKPRHVFSTHDAMLTQPGKTLSAARLAWAASQHGGEYLPIDIGDPFDL